MNAPSVPPQSPEAEESVLGSMMISARAIDVCAEILSPDGREFYRETNALIYKACQQLHQRGEPVDAVTLTHHLETTEIGNATEGSLLARVGGRIRLHEIAALVPASANVAHYARIVKELHMVRELIRAGAEISRLGWDRPDETPVLLERAEQIVFDVTQSGQHSELVTSEDAVREAYTKLVQLSESGNAIIGVPSGFKVLDEITSGFQPGNLIVIAARPSMGKTGLGLCIAANICIRSELPGVLFTLEMSRLEVMQRMMSSEALVNSQKVRNGRNLTVEDWQALTLACERLQAAPFLIDDSGLITVGEIRSKARRLKMRYPNLGFVMLDYLQLMASTGSEENRQQEVSKISRSLKLLARELEVPVIALSQLSRAVEQRHDKRPILSDLRESGAIEQDSDVVMFIYRDEYYNPEDTEMQGIAEVNVAKQRNGPTDTVKLSFVKKYARFGDLQMTP